LGAFRIEMKGQIKRTIPNLNQKNEINIDRWRRRGVFNKTQITGTLAFGLTCWSSCLCEDEHERGNGQRGREATGKKIQNSL
jgi:hypothetical protein